MKTERGSLIRCWSCGWRGLEKEDDERRKFNKNQSLKDWIWVLTIELQKDDSLGVVPNGDKPGLLL